MSTRPYDWADIQVTIDGTRLYDIKPIVLHEIHPPTLEGFRAMLRHVMRRCALRGWVPGKPIAIDDVERCRRLIEREARCVCPDGDIYVTVEGLADFVIRPRAVALGEICVEVSL